MTNIFCIMGSYVHISSSILYEHGFSDPYELSGDGFEVYKPCFNYDDGFYIGIPIFAMKDNQTLKEFRDEVIERFAIEFPFLNIDIDVEVLCDGW